MVEQLICASCGAPLKIDSEGKYKCEYCGAIYIKDGGPYSFRLETYRAPIQVLCAEKVIPSYLSDAMGEDDLSKYTISQLSNQLAEGLAACLKLRVRNDPLRDATIVRGEVRVVPPDFRF